MIHTKTLVHILDQLAPRCLKILEQKYIILGHSENRLSGETNYTIKKKIENSLKQKLNIIFCIGETYKEKKKGKTFKVLETQIKNSISKKHNLKKIIVAYEPVLGNWFRINTKQI